jgi:hypothetical protein
MVVYVEVLLRRAEYCHVMVIVISLTSDDGR